MGSGCFSAVSNGVVLAEPKGKGPFLPQIPRELTGLNKGINASLSC